MNSHQMKYMLQDVKIGLKRNRMSTIASISLLTIALVFVGTVLLSRFFIEDTMNYIESQVSMKVFVEDGLAEQVATVIEKQAYASHVEIEKAEQSIDRLRFFFEGKEHLLESFESGGLYDAVKFDVTNTAQMTEIAAQFTSTKGVVEVIYPQEMAKTLNSWEKNIVFYGSVFAIVLIILSFAMIYFTTKLSMFKRQKELKIKLLVGMNPKIIRLQFIVEGAVIGFIASIVAVVITWLMGVMLFNRIAEAVPFLLTLSTTQLIIAMSVQVVFSLVLSIVANYLSTRKQIAHV